MALEGAIICPMKISSPLYNSPINEIGGLFWSCNIVVSKNLFFET
jgi:hypothetical protein